MDRPDRAELCVGCLFLVMVAFAAVIVALAAVL